MVINLPVLLWVTTHALIHILDMMATKGTNVSWGRGIQWIIPKARRGWFLSTFDLTRIECKIRHGVGSWGQGQGSVWGPMPKGISSPWICHWQKCQAQTHWNSGGYRMGKNFEIRLFMSRVWSGPSPTRHITSYFSPPRKGSVHHTLCARDRLRPDLLWNMRCQVKVKHLKVKSSWHIGQPFLHI